MEARRDYLFAKFVKVRNGFQERKLMISCGRKD